MSKRIEFNEEQEYEEIISGYHGTDRAGAISIRENGFDLQKASKGGHLGRGIYFYQASRQSAIGWSSNVKGAQDVEVIKAYIRLGRCLDFFNEALHLRVKQIAKDLKGRGRPLTMEEVVNSIAAKMSFDTVRAAQTGDDPRPIMDGSEEYVRTRIIVCVRNVQCILKHEHLNIIDA